LNCQNPISPYFANHAYSSVDTTSTPNKRKRRSSPSPAPAPTPLKVILPSPSSISHANGTHIGISPPKVNGDAEHEPKRQKISLKISPNGVRKSPVPEEQEEVMEVEPEEEYPAEEAKQDQTELEVSKGRPLSKEIRGALALVISQ